MRQLAESYPVQVICRVWETPRSTYYYRSQASDDRELRVALRRLAGTWPRYGSRRLTAPLQREGFQVNRKHVQRLMQELGIQGHTYAKKRRTTNSKHGFPRYPNLVEQLEIVRPEQVWMSDITYIRLGRTPLTGGRKSGGVGKRAHRSVICDYENNRADGCVPGILPEPGLHGKREKGRGQQYLPRKETRPISVQDLRQDVQRAGRYDVRRVA